jgi:hypothetical protein
MKNASEKLERRSPAHLPGKAEKTESRDGWPVVLAYAEEGPGPWVVDLSHIRRWDIQGAELAAAAPKGLPLPAAPGGVALAGEALVGRTGMRQAFLWTFGGKPPAMGPACTETTEGSACLALLGRDVLRITEKLTSLDLGDPALKPPFLRPGPFAHVTAQIVVLSADPEAAAVLVACSRGFGHDLVHAVLQAGEEFGLRPAGESRFEAFRTGRDEARKPKAPARKPAAKSGTRSRAKS